MDDIRTVGQFPNTVREIENVWIPLADGTRLAARLWLPQDAETDPVPAILEYLPYRKRDGTATRDALTHPYFAGHGYACVRVDMRGSGESDGILEDEYLKLEQDDALEVIDWITAQPWCDGGVGMIGISWGGFNGLQVAARRPPALKAVVTICSTDDRYADDIHYKGGCLLGENLGWSSTMFAFQSRPPDPAIAHDRWRDQWVKRLENEPLMLLDWLHHQHRDDYWKHGSVCEDFSAIEAAVFAVGGWGDAYSNAVPRLIQGLPGPRLGLIGPWVHKYPHFAVPGPRIGFLQESLRWWDQWLKGTDTGIIREPLLRAYMMESVPPRTYYAERAGRWVAEDAWPPAGNEPRTYLLNADGLGDAAGDEVALAVCSPQDTGAMSGEFCPIWLGPEMPGDQRQDDAVSLTFDTPPLGERMEILGAPVVELDVASDRPQANVAVRLCDVAPDGASTRVTYGVLNLCHRESHEKPTVLEPGKRYRVRVRLDDIAWAFPEGHRIRLAISTAYWPLIWPSPETATLSVRAGASTLSLPVRPPRDETEPAFPDPEAAPPRRLETIRKPNNTRTVEKDLGSGRSVLRIVDDFGEERDKDTGLQTSAKARETWSILADDPTSARGETHWTETLARDNGWQVRTETFTTLTCDATSFRVRARLESWENDEPVLTREWDERIPRKLV